MNCIYFSTRSIRQFDKKIKTCIPKNKQKTILYQMSPKYVGFAALFRGKWPDYCIFRTMSWHTLEIFCLTFGIFKIKMQIQLRNIEIQVCEKRIGGMA